MIPEDGLKIVVFGRPQGKGSKRALPIRSKAGSQRVAIVDSNTKAAPWAHRVAAMAAAAMLEVNSRQETRLVRGAVSIELDFYFARPKSHFGTGRNAERVMPSAPKRMTTMPDLDKLCRCAIDALSGICIVDDSQICELSATKNYAEPERLEVVLHDLGASTTGR